MNFISSDNVENHYQNFINTKLGKSYYFFMIAVLGRFFFQDDFASLYNTFLVSFLVIILLFKVLDFKEFFNFILFTYLINIGNWFSRYNITEGAGSRILILDLLVIILLIYTFLFFFSRHKPRISFSLIITFMTLIWMFNFVRGAIGSTPGNAIGESRFYLFSFVMIGLMINKYNREDIYKLLKLAFLAAIVWTIWVLLSFVSNLDLYLIGELKRFNPGGFGVQIINYGIIFLFAYIILGSKVTLRHYILFLLISFSIFITGVRSVFVIYLVSIFYIYFMSKQLSFVKIYFSSALLLFGILIIYSFDFAFNTDDNLLINSILSTKTLDWRLSIWHSMINDALSSWERIIIGRPFGRSLIDISHLGISGWDIVDSSTAHNDFISFFMTNGIVYVLLIVIFILSLFIKISKVTRKNIQAYVPILVINSFFLSQVLMSATNAESRHYGSSILLWVYAGFLLNFLKERALNSESKPIKI